ncbi:ribonuclease HII [Reinekea marina]|uniref:Ribonuclease HII n=1 Tax=Reinekea marina TaxID=1310421 RepID=A0ABV7WM80_9GAMM|nr:ribonuclease HII [Reinekea marina]MDN3649951.1 ribonuclease HII [Reinekea marina]
MNQSDFDFANSAQIIAGVDEVGRGPLAGDVVTAAVILDENKPIVGLNDSKKLSEKNRQALAEEIKEKALCYCIARASVNEIDELNILQATLLAMARAVNGLTLKPDFCQIDGNKIPKGLPCPAEAIVKGDGKIAAISAASILAKVTRDQELVELHQRHPQYGFNQHKGYGTVQHLAAIKKFGVIDEHRRSFAPIRNQLELTS